MLMKCTDLYLAIYIYVPAVISENEGFVHINILAFSLIKHTFVPIIRT